MKTDILSKSDVDLLIDAFYEKISQIEHMKPYFEKVNWDKHIPIMRGFWYFTLLDIPEAYKGNVMNPHIHLHQNIPFNKEIFNIWLKVFEDVIHMHFEGSKAEEAILIAKNIGLTMQYKLLGSDQRRDGISITISDE